MTERNRISLQQVCETIIGQQPPNPGAIVGAALLLPWALLIDAMGDVASRMAENRSEETP